ncbi:hypothetical protein GCM10010371_37450 [Streptomyces subrutilus]|uniref:Uncharacterized protein n=1 Tax=Streptomyces subrutilus TaxID=36818 RepID=A0A918QXC1_9ACTN|nr:hypothetical protein GCM10010371_37450 [Streptomyces subrutilus]
MRHPLHIALTVPAPAASAAAPVPTAPARHRKPSSWRALVASVPPARRLAAGLGLVSVLAATGLTAAVDPAAPVAPDRAPARESSTFAQVSADRWSLQSSAP